MTNFTEPGDTHLQQRNTLHIFACVFSALIVIGICGNIIGAIVLRQVQKTTPGVRLLKYLAYGDTATLLLIFEVLVLPDFDGSPRVMVGIVKGLNCISFPLLVTVYTFEIYFTVLIACQRSFVLAKPLLSSVYMRASIVNKLILIVVCFSALFNIPEWLLYKRELYWDNEMNMTWITWTWPDPGYLALKDVYYTYGTLVFRVIVPMTVLIICNITIIISVRKRLISQSGRDDGNHLAAINIAIITVSMLTHVTTTIERFIPHAPYLYQISVLVATINCSANVIFYCTFGQSFRKALISMFKGLTRHCRCVGVRNEMETQRSGVTSLDSVM